jgi:hypothetical protein
VSAGADRASTSTPSATIARGGRSELVLAAAALTLVAIALFGRHVLHGGLSADDWAYAGSARFPTAHGVFADAWGSQHQRPMYAVALGAILALVGVHPAAWLSWSLLVAITGSLAFYATLRGWRIGRLDAAVLALLMLSFPLSDSTTLWFNAFAGSMAVAFYLAGLAVTLAALRARRPIWHPAQLAGAALYALSVMSEEISAPLVLGSALLYLLVTPPRAALRRFAVDAVVVVIVIGLLEAPFTHKPLSFAPDYLWTHVKAIFGQGLTVYGQAAFPFAAAPDRTLIIAVSLLVVALGAWRRSRAPGTCQAHELTRSLTACAAGALVTVAGWIVLIPGPLGYSPAASGNGNRINVAAAVGVLVGIYGLVRTAWLLALPGRFRTDTLVDRCSALVLLAILGGYVHRVEQDIDARDAAAAQQQAVLSALSQALPSPPRGATIYATGFAGQTAYDVPVFDLPWDLTGAVHIVYHDPTLRAWPLVTGSTGTTTLACGASGASVDEDGSRLGGESAGYGRAFFFSYSPPVAAPITGRRACERLAAGG